MVLRVIGGMMSRIQLHDENVVSICSVHEMRVPRADIREVKPGLKGPFSTFPFFYII